MMTLQSVSDRLSSENSNTHPPETDGDDGLLDSYSRSVSSAVEHARAAVVHGARALSLALAD